MGTPAPDAVKRLVDARDMTALSDRGRGGQMSDISDRVPSPAFLSGDYKEEQLRAEFLNPFFTALGWDVDNKQGLSETFKQVINEESIKACPELGREIAGSTKAPAVNVSMKRFDA